MNCLGIPRRPGFPDETQKTIYWCEKRPDTTGSGFFSELFTHVGQRRTHVDLLAHLMNRSEIENVLSGELTKSRAGNESSR
jgi:hypothetical protein